MTVAVVASLGWAVSAARRRADQRERWRLEGRAGQLEVMLESDRSREVREEQQ